MENYKLQLISSDNQGDVIESELILSKLSRRDQIAAMALQAILNKTFHTETGYSVNARVNIAIEHTDALIKQLDEPKN